MTVICQDCLPCRPHKDCDPDEKHFLPIIDELTGALLLAGLLYYLLRCCYTGMCCGPDPCDFMECCRRLDRPRYVGEKERERDLDI